jgi:DNA-binding response OmpR family regulator
MVGGRIHIDDRPWLDWPPLPKVMAGDLPAGGGGPKVLVVEDDESVRMTLGYNLLASGYDVVQAENDERGLKLARSWTPDLVVLDLMLPGVSGEDVCRTLRQESNVPILILTARRSQAEKVRGLELGADDYMTKPFGVHEFLSRVDALIRRSKRPPHLTVDPDRIRLGEFTLDALARRAAVGKQEVKLSPREFKLLFFLVQHAGVAHSLESLLRTIWGPDFRGTGKTVVVHVRWLRKKLEEFPDVPFRITTISRVGYRVDLAPGVFVEHWPTLGPDSVEGEPEDGDSHNHLHS